MYEGPKLSNLGRRKYEISPKKEEERSRVIDMEELEGELESSRYGGKTTLKTLQRRGRPRGPFYSSCNGNKKECQQRAVIKE